MKVAFLTARSVDPESTDDAHVTAAAVAGGHEVRWVTWDEPDVDWKAFDAVVVRSAWDYHLRPDEFRAWLDLCNATGVNLVNPPAIVRRNLHKSYLLDLVMAGAPVPPLVLLKKGHDVSLVAVLGAIGATDAVIKPAVAGGGWGAFRVSDRGLEASSVALAEALRERDMIVQKFVPEVLEKGEWSLVFIDGGYSHGVRKRPAAGDFRVQTTYGGQVLHEPPPEHLLAPAALALAELAPGALYGRVDLVESEAGPAIMEVELVEPVLFFEAEPKAAQAFVDALARRTRR